MIDALDHGRALPRRAVVVTFDDGYDDNYRVAFPILRELGMPATFFVSTGHIDSGRAYAYDWLVHMIRTVHAARLQVAELLELLGVGIERGRDGSARIDDREHHPTRLRLGLGRAVVELLAQPERPGHLRLGLRERRAELRRGLEAELGLREPELLLGRCDRVVDRDER